MKWNIKSLSLKSAVVCLLDVVFMNVAGMANESDSFSTLRTYIVYSGLSFNSNSRSILISEKLLFFVRCATKPFCSAKWEVWCLISLASTGSSTHLWRKCNATSNYSGLCLLICCLHWLRFGINRPEVDLKRLLFRERDVSSFEQIQNNSEPLAATRFAITRTHEKAFNTNARTLSTVWILSPKCFSKRYTIWGRALCRVESKTKVLHYHISIFRSKKSIALSGFKHSRKKRFINSSRGKSSTSRIWSVRQRT